MKPCKSSMSPESLETRDATHQSKIKLDIFLDLESPCVPACCPFWVVIAVDGGECGDTERIDLGWRPFLIPTTVEVDIFANFDIELCAFPDCGLESTLFRWLWDGNVTTLSPSISL